MARRFRPPQARIEAAGSPPATRWDPAAYVPPCPMATADRHICGCLDLRAPEAGKGLVSVISSDAAVRRSLVLLLEAEGLAARAFCTLAVFLEVVDRMAGSQRHCLVMEEEQARRVDPAWLARRAARDSGPVPIVVLTAAPAGGRNPALPPQDRVAFADPFRVDDVLRTIRSALGSP